jgi:hypothetical protein
MSNAIKIFLNACVCASILFIGSSCKDTDEYLSPQGNTNTDVKEANSFDYSTTREVDLIVDYSSFNAKVPVFFSV